MTISSDLDEPPGGKSYIKSENLVPIYRSNHDIYRTMFMNFPDTYMSESYLEGSDIDELFADSGLGLRGKLKRHGIILSNDPLDSKTDSD